MKRIVIDLDRFIDFPFLVIYALLLAPFFILIGLINGEYQRKLGGGD
jgi:hypothetical protein